MAITPFTEHRPILGPDNAVVNQSGSLDNAARYANTPMINIRRGGQPTSEMEYLVFGQGDNIPEDTKFHDVDVDTYVPADRLG